jgi:anti-sigma-K factor RskA
MTEPEIHDLAAPYVLDALGPEERWTYERHLDSCERCVAEVAVLRETAAQLAYGPEAPEPPPDLKHRILAAAREEPRAAAVVPLRPRWLFPATAAVATVAACAAVGLGLWANSLRDGPTQRIVAMNGGGRLLVTGADATLLACTEPAPAGKTYEAWVIRDGTPRPAGLFRGGCGSIAIEEPVGRGDTVAVTLERAGGVPAPEGEILMSADV